MSIIKLNTGLGLPHQLESLIFQIGFPVVRTDGRTYGHVITKISRIDRLPIFFSMRLRSRALRERVELRYQQT